MVVTPRACQSCTITFCLHVFCAADAENSDSDPERLGRERGRKRGRRSRRERSPHDADTTSGMRTVRTSKHVLFGEVQPFGGENVAEKGTASLDNQLAVVTHVKGELCRNFRYRLNFPVSCVFLHAELKG